jgi:hypothetical protein
VMRVREGFPPLYGIREGESRELNAAESCASMTPWGGGGGPGKKTSQLTPFSGPFLLLAF